MFRLMAPHEFGLVVGSQRARIFRFAFAIPQAYLGLGFILQQV